MKFIWELPDIECGRFVCKDAARDEKEMNGHTAKWTFKLGYIGGMSRFTPPSPADPTGSGVVLISMTDGCIGKPMSAEDMVKHLNELGMMPAPLAHMMALITHLRDTYET